MKREKQNQKLTLFEKHDGQIRTTSAHDDEHPKNSHKDAGTQHLRTGHQLQWHIWPIIDYFNSIIDYFNSQSYQHQTLIHFPVHIKSPVSFHIFQVIPM